MSSQSNSEPANVDLSAIGDATQKLFSLASTTEEMNALRDEAIRTIAESASDARKRIAAQDNAPAR